LGSNGDGSVAVNASLYQKLNFDPKAFVPVSILATIPIRLVVNTRLPTRTMAELIAFAKANPARSQPPPRARARPRTSPPNGSRSPPA